MPRKTEKHPKKGLNQKQTPSAKARKASSQPIRNEWTLIVLPTSEIEEYENNPRRLKNPNYLKIKKSIASNGLSQPLVVSQRPEESSYVVYKGGNTRLIALKELLAETGDRQYSFVACSLVPWSGLESDAVVGHLQENEMRNSLCFIDKAYGVKIAIDCINQETKSDKELSIRDCRSLLADKGYSVSLGSLSTMLYAAHTIDGNLPRTVSASMGRPQIRKLRKLQKAFAKVCNEFNHPEEFADHLFEASLREYSGTTWNFKLFRRQIEAKLSHIESTSIQDIALRLDGYLNLSTVPLSSSIHCFNGSFSQKNTASSEHLEAINVTPNKSVYTVNTSHTKALKNENDRTKTSSKVKARGTSSRAGVALDSSTDAKFDKKKSSKSSPPKFQLDIQRHRKNAFTSACRIARSFGFYSNPETKQIIVSNTGDWGIGYMITDYPPLLKNSVTRQTSIRDTLWWILLEFCDLQWATDRSRPMVARLTKDSDLKHFVQSGDSNTIARYAKGKMNCTIPHLSLLTLGLRNLSDKNWSELTKLADAYRCVHQIAKEHNVNLFSSPHQGGI